MTGNKSLSIGIIREGKVPPDERVPLTPAQLKEIASTHPELTIKVQSSPVRRIKDEEYAAAGFAPVDSVADCDILVGVKEVPTDELISAKTYFFFSHTIKMQPYNKGLLQAIMQRGITLIDWECLTDAQGRRLIGFGRYAGIVGAYNGLRAFGQKTGRFDLKKAQECVDQSEVSEELKKVDLPALKILLTGRGKVAKGAMEILDELGIQKVGKRDYLNTTFDEPVYCQITFPDYFKRKDGTEFNTQRFYDHPEEHRSDFMRFAEHTDMYIAGHYWDSRSPFLFTREDARDPRFNISLVADISCDIDGPVASTLRPSDIANPFYGYDPKTESETGFDAEGAITVMAVDNLPCELPRDASRDFGEMFIHGVLPSLLNGDKHGILDRASITKSGALNAPYSYLEDWVNG